MAETVPIKHGLPAETFPNGIIESEPPAERDAVALGRYLFELNRRLSQPVLVSREDDIDRISTDDELLE